MLQRPGELRIDPEVEHAALAAVGDLLDLEAIEAEQPIRLIEPMLPHQRRTRERQDLAGIGMGLKAE